MNKSVEFIKHKIESGDCNNMTKEEFSNMKVVPFYEVVDMHPDGVISILQEEDDVGTVYADLKYDPDADFNYFTLETCYCDGTLMFMTELMYKIVEKIDTLQTHYSPAVQGKTIDFDKHRIHYIVGDFVINSYITESPDPNRPWMNDKFTAMLPIKFILEEINI